MFLRASNIKWFHLIAVTALLLLSYQNCQQLPGKQATQKPCQASECVDIEPDPSLISIGLSGYGSRIQIATTETNLYLSGSCSLGGFESGLVTATLTRAGNPSLKRTATANCTSGGWALSITGLQSLNPVIGASANLVINMDARDEDGFSILADPPDRSRVSATVEWVNTAATPPPGGGQTTSASVFYVTPNGSSDLDVHILVWPQVPQNAVPSRMELKYSILSTPTQDNLGDDPVDNVPLNNYVHIFSLRSANQGFGNASPPRTPVGTDVLLKPRVTIAGTVYTENGFIYKPTDVTNAFVFDSADIICKFATLSEVWIPVNFVNANLGANNNPQVRLEYRNLNTGANFVSVSTPVTVPLNGARFGYVKLTNTQLPNIETTDYLVRLTYSDSTHRIYNIRTLAIIPLYRGISNSVDTVGSQCAVPF